MHWNTVRPVLKTLLATCSGLTTLWENEPRDFAWTGTDTAAICLLSITSVIDLGTGEVKQTPAGILQLQESHISWKRISITARVESDVNTDDECAEYFIELARAKLLFRSSRELLASVNCGINEIMQYIPLPVATDGRMRSHGAFDFVLNCRAQLDDPSLLGTIGSVSISGMGETVTVGS